eukprot:SAG22_NODE_166_length_16765_cov_30.782791_15_plen_162_part_00
MNGESPSELLASGNTGAGGGWQICFDAPPPPPCIDCRFSVSSGPCTLTEAGRCVGRPDGYGQNEQCEIGVAEGGVLGACPVFTTSFGGPRPAGAPNGWSGDFLVMPDGRRTGASECPVGAILETGQTLTWLSNPTIDVSICATRTANGVCLTEGGWQVCFA